MSCVKLINCMETSRMHCAKARNVFLVELSDRCDVTKQPRFHDVRLPA